MRSLFRSDAAAAHERCSAFEGPRRVRTGLVVAKHRVVHAGDLKIGGDGDARQRDEPDARVVHLAAREQFAERLANLIADAIGTVTLSHDHEQ